MYQTLVARRGRGGGTTLPGTTTSRPGDRRSPTRFFALVLALSVPFWWVGAATHARLLPGLPVSALMVVAPVAGAAILTYRASGVGGVKGLLRRAVDYERIGGRVWLWPVFLLIPGVTALTYWLLPIVGSPLPPRQVDWSTIALMSGPFFVSALAEELGWSGYAIEAMQERSNALVASIALGGFWAAWHLFPLLQANHSLEWIAWWCLDAVAVRVVCTWLYNNTGRSVVAVASFHAVCNVCWLVCYDPRVRGVFVGVVASAVTVVWGPATLAGSRRVA